MKRIVFLSGLPRSGSTLFANILNQNPRFYATGSSHLVDLVRRVRDMSDTHDFAKATPADLRLQRKLGACRGLLFGYFAGIRNPVIFDKNRGWPTTLEFVSTLFMKRENVKVICCVRDLRDVLASFEKLYRKTSETSSPHQEKAAWLTYRTALSRAVFISGEAEPVGYARNAIIDAVTRGWRDNIHFVDYDKLTANPAAEIKAVYAFLDEKPFDHDFENVKATIIEDDAIHGFVGLHDIRPKVEPQIPQWSQVFDDQILDTPFWLDVQRASRFWELI